MSHRSHLRSLLLVGAAAAVLPACDVEPSSAIDYDVVAHVELARLQKAPWIAKAMEGGGSAAINLTTDDGKKSTLPTCAEVLKTAESLTLGTGNERVELYVEGALSKKDTQKCFDELKASFADGKSKTKSGKKETVRTAVLGDSLVAVTIGAAPLPAPTRARLKDLLDAEPSNSGKEAAWFTMHKGTDSGDVKYAEGWANADKGLDAHVQFEMKDEAKAAEVQGEVSATLLALKLSGEMADLAKAVKIASSGDTITADVKASDKQMQKMVKTMSTKAGSDSKGATITIEAK
jgi:hypothetical protein